MNQDPQHTESTGTTSDVTPADMQLSFELPEKRDARLEEFSMQIETGKSIKNHMKEIGASSKELWMTPIENFYVIPDFNPRVKNEAYHDGIRTLAHSIKTEGFYAHKPISVVLIQHEGAERLAVKDGHRRLEAAILARSMGAQIDRLPTIVSKDGETIDEMNWEALKTAEGQKLSTYEKAIQVRRLLKSGFSQAEIAGRSGYSLTAIGNMVKLIEAPKSIQNLVEGGKISPTLAINTIDELGANTAAQVLTEAAASKPKDKKVTKRSITKRESKPENSPDKVTQILAPTMLKILESLSEWENFDTLPTRMKEDIQTVLAAKNEAGQ